MSVWQGIVLGFIQGVTEFLPVSSSGHLVITESMLNGGELSTVFAAAVHFATIVAIMCYFWSDLKKIKLREGMLLIAATAPIGIAGVLLHARLNTLLNSPVAAGVGLLVTGCVNWLLYSSISKSKDNPDQIKDWRSLSLTEMVTIGVVQAIALLPGISRSGSTVAGGMWRKLTVDQAFRVSFLMAIPAILGATGYELVTQVADGGMQLADEGLALLVGTVIAGVVGYASLRLLRLVISKNYFQYFALYCWFMGLVVIAFVR